MSHTGICETVVINTENGPVEINKSDFDPKEHELFDAPKKPQPKKKDTK